MPPTAFGIAGTMQKYLEEPKLLFNKSQGWRWWFKKRFYDYRTYSSV